MAHEIGREMLALFERLGDPHLQMIGEWSVGAALFHLGHLEEAHVHLMRGLALHDPAFHGARVWQTGIEPGIFCRCELSRTLPAAGVSGTGAGDARATRGALAQALDHPQPLAFALLFDLIARVALRRPHRGAATPTRSSPMLCRRYGIAQELQWAAPLRGRAMVELGDTEAGVREMEQGLAAHTITRSALLRPYFLVLFAGALIRVGREADAARALDDAARRRGGQRSAGIRGRTAPPAGSALLASVGPRRRGRDGVHRGARRRARARRTLAGAPLRPRLRRLPGQSRPRRRGSRPAPPAPRLVHRGPRDARLRVRRGAAPERRGRLGNRDWGSGTGDPALLAGWLATAARVRVEDGGEQADFGVVVHAFPPVTPEAPGPWSPGPQDASRTE